MEDTGWAKRTTTTHLMKRMFYDKNEWTSSRKWGRSRRYVNKG